MNQIKDIPCRAKNPATCRYHSAQQRAEQALIAGDQGAYLQAQEDLARAATSREHLAEIENYFITRKQEPSDVKQRFNDHLNKLNPDSRLQSAIAKASLPQPWTEGSAAAYIALSPQETKPVAAMALRKGDIISLDSSTPKRITNVENRDGYNIRITYTDKDSRDGIELTTQLWATTPVARYSPLYKLNLERYNIAYQNAANDTYDSSKTTDENIDAGYQHLLDVYKNEIRNKQETKILRDNPEEVKKSFRWYYTANIDDPADN